MALATPPGGDGVCAQYHQSTGHTAAKLRAQPHFLDWAQQPDPIRRYVGAPLLPFVDPAMELPGQLSECLFRPVSAPRPLTAQTLSTLLYYSMSLSAWKQIVGTDHRWALRVNPSSGNLHPTEVHLAVHGASGLPGGVSHYRPDVHQLEYRLGASAVDAVWDAIEISRSPVLIVLTSIFWREAWKYRQRAYRYCNHDMGHAMGAVQLAAHALGWSVQPIAEYPDEKLREALALTGGDEWPGCLLGLTPGMPGTGDAPQLDPDPECDCGVPNQLSAEVIEYDIIESAHRATLRAKPLSREVPGDDPPSDFQIGSSPGPAIPLGDGVIGTMDLGKCIRMRRSAVDHDPSARMGREVFLGMLAAGVASAGAWGPIGPEARLISLFVYVHRVDDIEPGLYYINRGDFTLIPVHHSDQRQYAKALSLGQDIAGDACWTMSMVGDLERGVRLFGERAYRYMHWESGTIGQWLYLAATAAGYDATGIGAFFDDDVRRYIGLPDSHVVVYHFCAGKAVHDSRLTTLPAYPWSRDVA